MTIDETQQTIIEEFAPLADWFDKYEHLIGLGRGHELLDAGFRTDEYALSGCQSQVWIRPEMIDGKLHFRADSDSVIIKGILALLLRVLSGRAPAEIAEAELFFLKEIGLSTNLSPSRANGVATIVRHMKQCGRSVRR